MLNTEFLVWGIDMFTELRGVGHQEIEQTIRVEKGGNLAQGGPGINEMLEDGDSRNNREAISPPLVCRPGVPGDDVETVRFPCPAGRIWGRIHAVHVRESNIPERYQEVTGSCANVQYGAVSIRDVRRDEGG